MYDDSYRKRFTSVEAATHSVYLNSSDNQEKIICTHTHNHRDFEILVIKEGKAYFSIDDNTFLVETGDVILVNPHEIHSAYTTAEFIPLSHYCITFDLSLLLASPAHPATEICNKLIEGRLKFDNLIKSQKINELVLKTEQIFTEKNEGWEFFVSSILFEIFGHLCHSKNFTVTSTPTKSHIFIKKVLEFVENNFKDNITSSHAAEKLCYDKSYFCRLFKKNFGQSFGQYLNFHRIKHATEMMHSGYSVSQAAFSSGFNNLSYFTKVFKKYNNTLPSEIKTL